MEILLIPGKSLAQVSVEKVLMNMMKQGFYLQMPPAEKENWLAEFRRAQQALDGEGDTNDKCDGTNSVE
jgi:uncharacterized protein YcgL (UPF0745 family)